MDLETIRSYCLSKKGVSECFPFDEETLVFKVMDKMFLLCNINSDELAISVKCDSLLAMELRERYEFVTPAYHMNKKMWNTVTYTGEISQFEFLKMIDHSYDEVVKKMSKKMQSVLESMS